jgi:hypothetical protein
MSEKIKKMTDEEIAIWHRELDSLEPDCSTGKLGTLEQQQPKIKALLARARARKVNVNY